MEPNMNIPQSQLYEMRDEIQTGADLAFQSVCKPGLSRLLFKVQEEGIDFAILTAYKDEIDGGPVSRKANVERNRELRTRFTDEGMGVYLLVGHWCCCDLEDERGEPLPLDQCPPDNVVHRVERSYLVLRQGMSREEFKDFIHGLAEEFDQPGYLICTDGVARLMGTAKYEVLDEFTQLTIDKISRAYSRYVKKLDAAFVFEGIERPTAINIVKGVLWNKGIRWIGMQELKEEGYFDKYGFKIK